MVTGPWPYLEARIQVRARDLGKRKGAEALRIMFTGEKNRKIDPIAVALNGGERGDWNYGAGLSDGGKLGSGQVA